MNKEQIRERQLALPVPFQGYEHNADDELTAQMTRLVSSRSGLSIGVGDIWVHNTGSQIKCGYLTRQGELAIHEMSRRVDSLSIK